MGVALVTPWLQWLYATGWAAAIRENAYAFPWIECVHVLAITQVVGSISIVDLRLLGLAWRDRPVGRVLRDVLPITWASFGLAVASGFLLFSSNAPAYARNPFLRLKLVCCCWPASTWPSSTGGRAEASRSGRQRRDRPCERSWPAQFRCYAGLAWWLRRVGLASPCCPISAAERPCGRGEGKTDEARPCRATAVMAGGAGAGGGAGCGHPQQRAHGEGLGRPGPASGLERGLDALYLRPEQAHHHRPRALAAEGG